MTPKGTTVCELTGSALILGAGFTKAFCPNAPLAIARYDLDDLRVAAAHDNWLAELLELAVIDDTMLDIERLLTRLTSRLPHDFRGPRAFTLDIFQAAVRRALINAISSIVLPRASNSVLIGLAAAVVSARVNVVSMNYDDVLDWALFTANPRLSPGLAHKSDRPYWHPDTGYGFLCHGAETAIYPYPPVEQFESSSLLLKLHGSLNWRVRKGWTPPVPLEALVHHEPWFPKHHTDHSWNLTESTIASEPLIIPPVLLKSGIHHEPVFRQVWTKAYDVMTMARRVFFIGYSLPTTDLAMTQLLTESLRHLDDSAFRIVSFAPDEARRDETKARYRQLLQRDIPDACFRFDGAYAWAEPIASDYWRRAPSEKVQVSRLESKREVEEGIRKRNA